VNSCASPGRAASSSSTTCAARTPATARFTLRLERGRPPLVSALPHARPLHHPRTAAWRAGHVGAVALRPRVPLLRTHAMYIVRRPGTA
jgi:hypothetical protein